MSDTPPVSTRKRRITKYAVIHGSFTTADEDLSVKDIDERDRRYGRFRCGYHLVITRSGEVQRGREEEIIGSHCGVYNTMSVSICLIGGKSADGKWEDNYTLEQYDALNEEILRLEREYPGVRVVGYRELVGVRSKSPGF